jgi:hypothetical protein
VPHGRDDQVPNRPGVLFSGKRDRRSPRRRFWSFGVWLFIGADFSTAEAELTPRRNSFARMSTRRSRRPGRSSSAATAAALRYGKTQNGFTASNHRNRKPISSFRDGLPPLWPRIAKLPQAWPQRRRLFSPIIGCATFPAALPIIGCATFPAALMRPGRAKASASDRRFREGAQTVRAG